MDANVQIEPQYNPRGELIFKIRQPYHFVATKTFTIGGTINLSIRTGMDVLYDGTTAEIEGAEYKVPGLRGPVRQGWLVLASEYDPDANYNRPVRANIQVRHATKGGNPFETPVRTTITTTETDEREVGNVRQHAHQTRTANQGYVRGNGVNVVTPGSQIRTQHGMMVVEEQDGTIIEGREFLTPAGEKAKAARVNAEFTQQYIDKLSKVQVQPGEGISQDEMLSRMSPEEAEEYLRRKAAYSGQYVSEPTIVMPSPRKQVGRVASSQQRQQESMGIKTTVSFGGGTEISDGDGDVVHTLNNNVESYEAEGIKFTNTNGPKRQPPVARVVPRQEPVQEAPKVHSGPSAQVRLAMAKKICADFPSNYDFALSTKKKLARITADFEDRPDVLAAIFAAENDEMKSLLVEEFPAAFA